VQIFIDGGKHHRKTEKTPGEAITEGIELSAFYAIFSQGGGGSAHALMQIRISAGILRRSKRLDAGGEPGNLPGSRVLMDDSLCSRPHDLGLRLPQSQIRGLLVARGDRLLHLPHKCPHAAASSLIHEGAAFRLTRGLFRRFRIRHVHKVLSQAGDPRSKLILERKNARFAISAATTNAYSFDAKDRQMLRGGWRPRAVEILRAR
jgi:hypothetical protein